MAFTTEEEADLKRRILALEEELTAAKKREDGIARKADLDMILADLKEARKELAALKTAKPPKTPTPAAGPDRDDPGDILDMHDADVGGEGV